MDDGYHEDRFLATDGSNNIFEIDPNTWSVISKTPVSYFLSLKKKKNKKKFFFK